MDLLAGADSSEPYVANASSLALLWTDDEGGSSSTTISRSVLTGGRQWRLRQILYRASLSEMVVPYGDNAPIHRRKNVSDAAEYSIGTFANSLELGCDCLGEIRYFDAVLADGDGDPYTISNAICLHEEDFGILWKHTDLRTMSTR